MEKQHILVPCDLSDQSLVALSQTYNLSRFTNSDITLLYVKEEDKFLSRLFSSRSNEEDALLMRKIDEELKKIAAEASSKSGVKVNTLIKTGKVYEQIIQTAEDLKAIFIVMGKSSESGITKFLGSNTLRIVREAPCAVITVRGTNYHNGCKNIVLPLDLSKETKEKVNSAIEIARYFGSAIRVLSAHKTSDEFLINKMKRQLSQVTDFIKERGIECTGESITDQDPADAVLEYAEKIKADLIVIMTEKETDLTDIFMGSGAEKIILGTDVPIMSIKPMERSGSLINPYV